MTLSVSDIITLVSILFTAASIIWAVYERAQGRNARAEAKRFRKLLIKQQVSQQFSGVPLRALMLFRQVRASEWDKTAESALVLSADLASLNGARAEIVGDANKKALEVALEVMGDINRHLPRSETGLTPELQMQLTEACNVILISVHTIERSLSLAAALGGEDDEH